MVRGNWQKRVETAQARRVATAERKQRSANNKAQKQLLLQIFQNSDDEDSTPPLRHVWTDRMPSNGPPILDVLDTMGRDAIGGGGGMENSNHKGSKKKKDRGKPAGRSRKAHPRSRESLSESTSDDKDAQRQGNEEGNFLMLCRHQFFQGHCPHRKKCHGVHYSNQGPYVTLADTVTSDESDKLDCAFDESNGDEVGEVIPMLYYLPLVGSETAQQQLSDQNIQLSNIVYVVADKALVFDRYSSKGSSGTRSPGENVQNRQQHARTSLSRHPPRPRGVSWGSAGTASSEQHHDDLRLPGVVFRHLLRFLPDQAVGQVSAVCRRWCELVNESPPWIDLLQRRNWPGVGREDFVRHYSAVRSTKAILHGLDVLMARRANQKKDPSLEVSVRDYLACSVVAVKIWSPRQMLVAQREDCVLRLFEALPTGTSREIVCFRADPYRKTRKRSCQLVDVAVDKDFICCLCNVQSTAVPGNAVILNMISRDDFLIADPEEDDSCQHTVDVGQAILAYILATDGNDEAVVYELFAITEFLQMGGEIGDLQVTTSASIVPCGSGLFAFEATIFAPNPNIADGRQQMGQRKLVVFSPKVENVVWMKDCLPEHLDLGDEKVVLSSAKCSLETGYRNSYAVTASCENQPHPFKLVVVDRSGNHMESQQSCETARIQQEVQRSRPGTETSVRRMQLVTPTAIVVADVLSAASEGTGKRFLSELKLQSWCAPDANTPTANNVDCSVCLQSVNIHQMCCLHQDYILVYGSYFGQCSPELAQGVLLTVHLPTGTVLERLVASTWKETTSPLKIDFTPLSASSASTVGACIDGGGIILTGPDVWEVRRPQQTHLHIIVDSAVSSKKKKKKKTPKGGKKDGFARGMSLRG